MAVNNSLQKSTGKQKIGFTDYLSQDAVKAQIQKAIGKNADRFTASIISAVNQNPQLADCNNASIVAGALTGEALKLSPSPTLGNYYLLPFNDKERGKVAQFVIGYKGLINLAIRSGVYKKLNVLEIKDGELIKYDPLNEEIEVKLIEDENLREKTETIGYYAMFEYINGFRKVLFWTKTRMENFASTYSAGYRAKKGYTFWEKDFDSMAKKTMLRQLISKWGVMSITYEMEQALEADQAVINEDGTKVYVDNAPDDVVVDAKDVTPEPKDEPMNPPVEAEEMNAVQQELFS